MLKVKKTKWKWEVRIQQLLSSSICFFKKLFYFEIITESQKVTKITYWKMLKPKNKQAHRWLALSDDIITDHVVCGKHPCPTRGRMRMKMVKNILVLSWKHFWFYVLIDTMFENTYFEPLKESQGHADHTLRTTVHQNGI